MVPKQSFETRRPVLPRVLYFMGSFPYMAKISTGKLAAVVVSRNPVFRGY
jgi:hypothetical protein